MKEKSRERCMKLEKCVEQEANESVLESSSSNKDDSAVKVAVNWII